MTFGQFKRRGSGSVVSLQRAACCLLAFVLATHGSSAHGTEFSWVPVDADVVFSLAGSDDAGQPTEIILDEGPATIVEFELRINGWSQATGSPTLGTAQASVDATGFLGVNAVPSNPGVDLTPLNNQPWRENSLGNNGLNDGAFMALQTCHDFGLADTLQVCASSPSFITWDACPAGSPLCLARDDFMFAASIPGVATHTPNYVWGAVTAADCTTDVQDNAGCTGLETPRLCCTDVDAGTCPSSFYVGTLVLNVPAGAQGTYSFGFNPAIAQTFMSNCAGDHISGEVLTPGKVTLRGATGKCCFNTRIDPQCIDSVTESDCNAELAPRFFTLSATCSGAADECAIDCDGMAVSAGGQRAGDFAADGLVDLNDLQFLRPPFCRFSGPDTPMASPSTCDVFDFDCDGDIDLRDFSGFQNAFAP